MKIIIKKIEIVLLIMYFANKSFKHALVIPPESTFLSCDRSVNESEREIGGGGGVETIGFEIKVMSSVL